MKAIIIALVIAAFAVTGVTIFKQFQEKKIVQLENMISELGEKTVPVKFKVQKIKNSQISLKIFFLDLNGKKVKEADVDLNGNEIHFDFQIVELNHAEKKDSPANKQYLFYPYRLFSDVCAPDEGIDLCSLYDKNGFPLIYKGFVDSLSKDNKKLETAYFEELKKNFNYIQKGEIKKLSNQYGSAVHDMKDVSEFKKGYVYSITCSPHTGALEVVRE